MKSTGRLVPSGTGNAETTARSERVPECTLGTNSGPSISSSSFLHLEKGAAAAALESWEPLRGFAAEAAPLAERVEVLLCNYGFLLSSGFC